MEGLVGKNKGFTPKPTNIKSIGKAGTGSSLVSSGNNGDLPCKPRHACFIHTFTGAVKEEIRKIKPTHMPYKYPSTITAKPLRREYVNIIGHNNKKI